jgi:hypothetical protein
MDQPSHAADASVADQHNVSEKLRTTMHQTKPADFASSKVSKPILALHVFETISLRFVI